MRQLALVLCAVLPLALALGSGARAEVPKPLLMAQEGNACLPTSAAMALHSLGEPTTPRDIARRLPFHKDGTDFFDLQEELTRRGYASLVLTAGPEAIAAAIEAGYPVVAAVHAGKTKHAVMVWGVRTKEGVSWVQSVDPRGGVDREESFEAFRKLQFARQLLVIWPQDQPAAVRLEAAGFPLEDARKTNARFRAEALVFRAERHSEPNSQMLELLRRAVKEDPSWAEARARLEEVEGG